MQYTLRNVPQRLDELMRQKAREQDKSLNEVAIDALSRAFELTGEPLKHRDLGDIAGTWETDREVDRALADQRRIEPELWR